MANSFTPWLWTILQPQRMQLSGMPYVSREQLSLCCSFAHFQNPTYTNSPEAPFVIGRAGFDQWLMHDTYWHGFDRSVALVDATNTAPVIHQTDVVVSLHMGGGGGVIRM